jgi:hypothetical protein
MLQMYCSSDGEAVCTFFVAVVMISSLLALCMRNGLWAFDCVVYGIPEGVSSDEFHYSYILIMAGLKEHPN